ncbi:MAG TPA: antitoxin Xre/MbcA/ParS toxin-binding domain-containing protein [Burkholderiales bacterium]|nr:antitoxin Xre/MbcA/ParS toxin-binding domain-containing protein [Burkholderiales bacterium]
MNALNPAPGAEARGKVLAKATMRAASLLGLNQADLAPMLGVSRATVSRIAGGTYALAPEQKTWELAALFVRLFRSLDALVGSNETQARLWLNSENIALGAVPRSLLSTAEGLVRVVQYLDAARGEV